MNPDDMHTLYRFFDAEGQLIYIGITNSIPRRLEQHSDRKPWYAAATTITMEHFPDRDSVLAAEKLAIQAERPRFNIQHARRSRARGRKGSAKGRWTFETRRWGNERTTDLFLYPELDGSSMIDDYDWLDGEGQFAEYLRHVAQRHPEWLSEDAVPIVWSVVGDATMEAAPFQAGAPRALADEFGDFLAHFSRPYDAQTGELLDFFKLPVRMDWRFPEFAAALAWTPSPMQPTCPLRSIIESRRGAW